MIHILVASFQPSQKVEETFRGIRHINRDLADIDINSDICQAAKVGIGRAVYSGKPGVLIAASTLKQFNEVLHVHVDICPISGNTFFYLNRRINWSLFSAPVNPEIDQGDVIVRRKLPYQG